MGVGGSGGFVGGRSVGFRSRRGDEEFQKLPHPRQFLAPLGSFFIHLPALLDHGFGELGGRLRNLAADLVAHMLFLRVEFRPVLVQFRRLLAQLLLQATPLVGQRPASFLQLRLEVFQLVKHPLHESTELFPASNQLGQRVARPGESRRVRWCDRNGSIHGKSEWKPPPVLPVRTAGEPSGRSAG